MPQVRVLSPRPFSKKDHPKDGSFFDLGKLTGNKNSDFRYEGTTRNFSGEFEKLLTNDNCECYTMTGLSKNNNFEVLMKRRIFIALLGIEAVICVVLNIMQITLSEGLTVLMAFPFEQVGKLLRLLSLSGGVGNAVAIIIYTGVSLIPVAILLVLMKKRKLYREDGLFILMSAVLFVVLYLMINPGIINSLFDKAAGLAISKAILGGTVYSIICSYLVLRVLRLFFDSNETKLKQYMVIMLCLLNVFFVYMFSGFCFSSLLSSIATLRAGNTGNELLLGITYIFLVLQYIVDALPYLFDIFVVFAALRLLSEIHDNRYSDESIEAAGRLSHLCGIALKVTILTNVAFNLLQLLFARILMVINSSIQIPLLSIIFVLAVLLLARLIAENKKLKDDNDMFI